MQSLGLDIGGANTKAVLFQDREIEDHWFGNIPLWKGLERLKEFLEDVEEGSSPQVVGVTMTGELADIFSTKRDGVEKLVGLTQEVFSDSSLFYLSLEGEFLSRDEALSSLEELAASNWVSSALFLGDEYPDSLMVDVGSTTSDLIPIKGGEPSPSGWTDYGRLKTRELVYTGVLRTPLPYLKSRVELDGESVGLAAEYFANMADVYRVLGLISESSYTCETPDGKGKGGGECMRRIARVFCSDLEELGREKVEEAAEVFREEQVSMLREALVKVTDLHDMDKSVPVLVTGAGRNILAERSAREADFDRIVDVADVYDEFAALMTPAYGLGRLVAEVGR